MVEIENWDETRYFSYACQNNVCFLHRRQLCHFTRFKHLWKEMKKDNHRVFVFVQFRLWHICGSGHAQKPLSLSEREWAETDAGFMQDVIGKTSGCGAPAGHQELPSPVCVTVEILHSSSHYCLAPRLRSLTARVVTVWHSSDNSFTHGQSAVETRGWRWLCCLIWTLRSLSVSRHVDHVTRTHPRSGCYYRQGPMLLP